MRMCVQQLGQIVYPKGQSKSCAEPAFLSLGVARAVVIAAAVAIDAT
eukprot:SAG11_NODE_40_length_21525_cov_16.276066_5_plen_47_part_00